MCRLVLSIFLLQIFLLNVIAIIYKTPPKNHSYKLGPNLVTNPNISNPVIAPKQYANFPGSIEGWATKGKFVEYIEATLYANNEDICSVFKGVSPGQQFIDVDSVKKNEQYYQQFNLTAGRDFQLNYDWISEKGFRP